MNRKLRAALAALVAVLMPMVSTGSARAAGASASAAVKQAMTHSSVGLQLSFYASITPEATPAQQTTVHSDLGALLLADRQLLTDAARGTINDLDNEQELTSFVTIVDAITSLRSSWSQQRRAFAVQNGGYDTPASDRAWQYGASIFLIGCADGVLPPKACATKP